MNLWNYADYALFDYEQSENCKDDIFELGDVVVSLENKEENSIGVIIQRHGNNEYRTDAFGNCCEEGIRLATEEEILKFRPNIKSEGKYIF